MVSNGSGGFACNSRSISYLFGMAKVEHGKKIKRVEKPRAGSSMKIAPISTDATERMGNNLAIRGITRLC